MYITVCDMKKKNHNLKIVSFLFFSFLSFNFLYLLCLLLKHVLKQGTARWIWEAKRDKGNSIFLIKRTENELCELESVCGKHRNSFILSTCLASGIVPAMQRHDTMEDIMGTKIPRTPISLHRKKKKKKRNPFF